MFHFRTHAGNEVDILLEDRRGRIVGVEIKAAGTVSAQDFRGLRFLADATGRRFVLGLVLYLGNEAIPFGPRLHALPLNSLWNTAE
jgi:predicted AAA+ superfamily ATPase